MMNYEIFKEVVKHDVNPLSSIRECIPKQGRHDDDRPYEQAV